MKNRKSLIVAIMAVLLALVLAVVGLVSAQVGRPGDESGSYEPGTVALLGDVIQIQSQLVDSSGNPANGSFDIIATVYDAPSGGTARCSKSGVVDVSDGLFTMDMEACTPADFTGGPLWLGIQINSEPEITPRQEIYVEGPESAVAEEPPVEDEPLVQDMTADESEVLAPGAVAAILDDVVQVQGRLTNASGVPINGTRTITTTLYDASIGGTVRCRDSDSVTAVNGLFTMAMDFCTASDFNGDALWMGVQVGTDPEMTPRQQIYAVPYAWALRPGAIVKGADSYVFMPGSSLVKNLSADTTRWDIQSNGAARIWRGAAAGNKIIYFPITLPGVLYGQNVTLEQLTIYYKCSSSTLGYITRSVLNVATDADSFVNVIDSSTNHTSTTASSYTFNLTTNNVLTSGRGNVVVFIELAFSNDVNYVDIGGIRLRLGHQ